MLRKPSQRQGIVAAPAALRTLQQEPPSFFRDHDRRRLAEAWARKVSELVELELATYNRREAKWRVGGSNP